MVVQTTTIVSIDVLHNVKGNHFHGVFSFCGDRKDKRPASFFYYPSYEEANRSYDLMVRNKEFVKTNYHIVAEAKQGEGWYLLTEELVDIKDWVKDNKNVWYEQKDKVNYHLDMGKVLPSEEFIKVFRPIILFLGRIHFNRTYHGRISEGVFFRPNKSICFANFGMGDLDLCGGIRKDLKDLVNFIKETCQRFQIDMPYEFSNFEIEVSNLPEDNDFDDLMNFTWFIYNHLIFWTNARTRSFLSKVWQINGMRDNVFRQHFKLSKVGPWWLKVDTAPRYWKELYDHGSTNQFEGKKNQFEGKNYTLLKYIRNALEHPLHEDRDETLRQFKYIWHDAILLIYEEVMDITTKMNYHEREVVKSVLMKKSTPFKIDSRRL